jgi:hypothetical protein
MFAMMLAMMAEVMAVAVAMMVAAKLIDVVMAGGGCDAGYNIQGAKPPKGKGTQR